ncbi:MAG: tetratricopeptide repeat protein [Thermoanaerobaculum sp.]
MSTFLAPFLCALLATAPPIEKARELLGRGEYAQARALLQPLAEGGDPEAQYLLGHALDQGFGSKPDPREALAWWLRAASQGHPEATFRAGMAYLHGRGVDPDVPRALELLKQAATYGSHLAELEIGKALLLQSLGAGHEAEAALWLDCAARGGNREAAEILGSLYARGTAETLPDRARAVKYLRLAEALGSTVAPQLLAEINPAKDVTVATEENVHLLREAASLGYPDAQFRLAVLGLAHVPWGPSREEAQMLLEVAALNGHPEACYRLLQLRRKEKHGVSPVEAEDLLRKAAEGGFYPAALELGQLLAARNSPEALRWLRVAYNAGLAWAALDLAQLFFEGLAVPANPQEAFRILEQLVTTQDPLLRKRAAALVLRYDKSERACTLALRLDPASTCGPGASTLTPGRAPSP